MECKLADEEIAVCCQTRNEMQFITERNKNEVDYFLNAKLKQIDFIIGELKIQSDTLNIEIDATVPYINRLIKTNDSLSYPKQIALKCKHISNAVISDDDRSKTVGKELIKEIDKLTNARAIIENSNDQIKEQLRKYRSLKYRLDRNIDGKEIARAIEKQNIELGTLRVDTLLLEYPSCTLSEYTVDEWHHDSDKLLGQIRNELQRGRKLRYETDTTIRNLIDDLQHQHSVCNANFLKCIEQYKERKNELEHDQLLLNQQMKKMKQNIEELQTAITDKKPYMTIACTRINNRKQRPGIEFCRDDVENKLFNEVAGLNETNSRLMEALTTVQVKLSDLHKAEERTKLEIAKFTLLIKTDEVECMTIRNTVHFHKY